MFELVSSNDKTLLKFELYQTFLDFFIFTSPIVKSKIYQLSRHLIDKNRIVAIIYNQKDISNLIVNNCIIKHKLSSATP